MSQENQNYENQNHEHKKRKSYLEFLQEQDKQTSQQKTIYKLNNFKELERLLEPQNKVYYFVGQASAGKTLLFINLIFDFIFSNENIKILFFSFDQNKEQITERFRSFLSDKSKLKDIVQKGSLDVLDSSDFEKEMNDGSVLDSIKIFLKDEKEKNKDIIVFFDGLHNLPIKSSSIDEKRIRILHEKQAITLQEINQNLDIPVFATGELNSQGGAKETTKYEFNSDFFGILKKEKQNKNKIITSLTVRKNRVNGKEKYVLFFEFEEGKSQLREHSLKQPRDDKFHEQTKTKKTKKIKVFEEAEEEHPKFIVL